MGTAWAGTGGATVKGARAWPAAIVAVLAVTVAANAYLLHVATDRNGAVVEPDYYRKALAWDSTAALNARSEVLGWQLVAAIGPLDRAGTGRVSARITDRSGAPLTGATVRVTAIHNLEADRRLAAELPAVGDAYEGLLALRHSGLWELRFDVTRGADRFAVTARCEALPSAGAR